MKKDFRIAPSWWISRLSRKGDPMRGYVSGLKEAISVLRMERDILEISISNGKCDIHGYELADSIDIVLDFVHDVVVAQLAAQKKDKV